MDAQTTLPGQPTRGSRHLRRWGALAGSLAVVGGLAGGGAAIAAVRPAPPSEARATDANSSADPRDAFWDAGYTSGDAYALVDLWETDLGSAKARVGRALLDGQQPPTGGVVDVGQPVPWAPGTHPEPSEEEFYAAQAEAFAESGYTASDVRAVAELWDEDLVITEDLMARAVLFGQEADLPVPPSGTPAVD